MAGRGRGDVVNRVRSMPRAAFVAVVLVGGAIRRWTLNRPSESRSVLRRTRRLFRQCSNEGAIAVRAERVPRCNFVRRNATETRWISRGSQGHRRRKLCGQRRVRAVNRATNRRLHRAARRPPPAPGTASSLPKLCAGNSSWNAIGAALLRSPHPRFRAPRPRLERQGRRLRIGKMLANAACVYRDGPCSARAKQWPVDHRRTPIERSAAIAEQWPHNQLARLNTTISHCEAAAPAVSGGGGARGSAGGGCVAALCTTSFRRSICYAKSLFQPLKFSAQVPLAPRAANLDSNAWVLGEIAMMGGARRYPHVTQSHPLRPRLSHDMQSHPMDQRFIWLPVERTETLPTDNASGARYRLTVRLSADRAMLVPGQYMIFVLNRHGVPSTERFVVFR